MFQCNSASRELLEGDADVIDDYLEWKVFFNVVAICLELITTPPPHVLPKAHRKRSGVSLEPGNNVNAHLSRG